MINQLNFKPLVLTAIAVFSLNMSTAFADGVQDAIPVAKALSGNTQDDGWYNLSNSSKTKIVDGVERTIAGSSRGNFPGGGSWSSPITSQVKSDNNISATLNKVANGGGGGAYTASSGLYIGGISSDYNLKGSTLGVYETAPVSNLANLVFQVELGAANGYDFYRPGTATGAGVPDGGNVPTGSANNLQVGALTGIDYSPILNFTYDGNKTASVAANFAELSAKGDNGTIQMPTGLETLYVNLYSFQWDLSSYSNISSFNITFDVVQHSQVYALRLTQSDAFNQVTAVPEPESYALFMIGLGMLGFVARRRQA